MKARWIALRDAFDAKTLRERVIVAMVILALIYAIFDFSLFAAINKDKAAIDARMNAVQLEMKKLSAQELVLARALTNDPSSAKRREIDRLEIRTAELEGELQKLSVGLIAADKLPEALHDVLQEMGSLRLQSMETLAPTKLRLNTPAVAAPKAAAEKEKSEQDKALAALDQPSEAAVENVGVFKHAVVVSLEGQYFDVVRYIAALEKLPWKIYWEGLEYQVTQYPKASVTIKVYTLSTDKGVLGV